MYIIILVKQVYWYISRVSGECLQDHWSSGIIFSAGPIGGCQLASNGQTYKMGYIQSKPVASTDGTLSLRYMNGDLCHKGKANEAHRSTRINFFCSGVNVSRMKS